MTAPPLLSLIARPLDAIAGEGDRLSLQARVHHAHSLGPERIVLPPMPIGATFLERWPVREGPGDVSWRDDHYMSIAPALFVVRNALVHSSAGLIGIDGAVVSETLAHTDPARQSFRRTGDGVALAIGRLRHLAGTHITTLAGASENYFHAMLEGVLRLSLVTPHWLHAANSVLYVKGGIQQAAVLRDLGLPASLALNPVGDDETLVVETLVYPLSAHGLAAYHPCLNSAFDTVAGNVRAPSGDLPSRFYVDRSGANRRVLLNEDAVIDALRPLGIVPVRLEAMSFETQVKLFRGASLIVAPHGAGLTNVGFCRPDCRLLELQMDSYANWLFRRLAALRTLRYDCVLGRTVGGLAERDDDPHHLTWQISTQHVAAAAHQMLAEKT